MSRLVSQNFFARYPVQGYKSDGIAQKDRFAKSQLGLSDRSTMQKD